MKPKDEIVNNQPLGRLDRCHADRDGDCWWSLCPQNLEGEPMKSGRHCPLDCYEEEM